MPAFPSPRPLAATVRGFTLLVAATVILSLAGLAIDYRPFAIDRAIIVDARAWNAPRWFMLAAEQLTALGSVPVLVVVVVAAGGLLAVAGRWPTAIATLAGTALGGFAVALIKLRVHRARPEVVRHLVVADGMSFPSGHAAGSAIVYLTLAALVAQTVERSAIRTYILAFAVVLVTTIGASRVYLGVHWPTDVLAGWCFGAAWAHGCRLVTSGMRR